MVSPKSSSEELPGLYHRQQSSKSRQEGYSRYLYILGVLTVLVILLLFHSPSAPAAYLSFSSGKPLSKPSTSLDSWITAEEYVAYDQIYQNLGGGTRAKDAALGAVIASPSTEEPDYYYQWVRDAAITYKTIIGQYIQGNESLGPLIKHWARSQDAIQHTQNPSGDYHSGGIGEPKFMVDDSPYMGSWGRPQDDGPAIRATVLMAYAKHFLATGGNISAIQYLYNHSMPANSVIKADLEYVSHNWQQDSFDLWEEVKGFHFFTLIVQLRSMVEGAEFAEEMSDHGASMWYSKQAEAMRIRLDDFWTDDGWIKSTLIRDPEKPRGGLDCGTLLGTVHGFSRLQTAYAPESDRMLSTHYHLVQSMKALYKINHSPQAPGVAIGRYPEDVYDGYHKSSGNPWYLCTTTAAEHMYTAARSLDRAQNITITATSLKFYQQFLPNSAPGNVFHANTKEFRDIVEGMRAHGDTFMSTVRYYAQSNGSLSEQFNRDTGDFQGARDLTWSYGAFISSVQARQGRLVF